MAVLRIASTPISVNQLERMHWAVKAKLRRELGWKLRVAASEAGLEIPGGLEHRRILVRLFLPRRFDRDNAVGGLKILIDAMRDVGLVARDSVRWLDLDVEQVISPERRIEISIEEGADAGNGTPPRAGRGSPARRRRR